jgi:hypothetical protein
VAIAGNNCSAETRRDDARLASDIEYVRAWSEHDARNRGVAGELAHCKGVQDESIGGLMKATGPALQPWKIDMNVDMGALAADQRRLAPFEKCTGEVAEGVRRR